MIQYYIASATDWKKGGLNISVRFSPDKKKVIFKTSTKISFGEKISAEDARKEVNSWREKESKAKKEVKDSVEEV